MAILIGYQSALDLWRRPEIYGHMTSSTSVRLEVPSPDGQATWELSATVPTLWNDTLSCLPRPWHLMSSRGSHHAPDGDVVWHSRKIALPPRSGIRLDDDVFLVSPELCLLQMAQSLPCPSLIELIDEFCGTYRPASSEELTDEHADGLVQRPPITSLERLSAYLATSPGVGGIKRARRALRYAVDLSASPKETHSELLFSLPVPMGGKGCPKPEMNKRFDVPIGLRQAGDPGYVECDLCWTVMRDGKVRHVAVEYQSTAHHVGAERLAADSRRRNLLESMGVHVITLTAAELYSQRGFDRVAALVTRELGLCVRTCLAPEEVARRTARLRLELLGSGRR
jgi:hypothetical protein